MRVCPSCLHATGAATPEFLAAAIWRAARAGWGPGRPAPVVGGPGGDAKSPPGRWGSWGRAEIVPMVEGSRGRESSRIDGSRESDISLAVVHRRNGALAGRGSMPQSGQPQSLAETVQQGRTRFRDGRGGSAGDGTSPRQGARGNTTHTLCSVLLHPFTITLLFYTAFAAFT